MLGLIIGWIRRRIANARLRRLQRSIERQNAVNKNVIEYFDAPVEAYVSKTVTENIVVSGNNKDIRDRVCCAATYNAYKIGTPVVVLHCGNTQLENLLAQAFSLENGLHMINESNKLYDPFLDLDKDQISELVLNSATESYKVNHNGGIYIKGLTDYLLARAQIPCARSYIRCPHDSMWERIQEHERNGILQSDVAREINDELTRGQVERGNVEQYFRALNRQASCILADKDTICNGAINIRNAINANQVIVIDIVSSSCDLLINLLVQEMKDSMSAGKNFTFVLDSVPVDSSEALGKLLRNFSSKSKFVYSSRDVYAETASTENLFDTLLGKANTVFITQHDSAETGEKISEYLGKYQKTEVNNTLTSGDTYAAYNQILPGYSNGSVVTQQRIDRPRVEESEITGLGYNRLFIKKEQRSEVISVRSSGGTARETYSEPRRKPFQTTSRGTFSWWIFIILFVLCFPISFIYGFFASGRRGGKIVFGILFLLSVIWIVVMAAVTSK